ncbi:MAG: hypothetical protein QOJ35_3139 [Solirubrobacteraceae bacterium]|jgi:glycosyltransferase involved in cell wall biosynthesis|nr:hypothetical protein [Solirubrobacteraceae bacterium]
MRSLRRAARAARIQRLSYPLRRDPIRMPRPLGLGSRRRARRSGMLVAMGELVLIPGRDVLDRAGGSESYVRGHAHAATAAGYRPHLYSVGRRAETVDERFGVLHRCATPWPVVRSIFAPLHRPWLVPAVVRQLRDLPGPHVIHAFGVWADSAVCAAHELAGLGVIAIPVATVYTPIEHEARAKLGSTVVGRNSPQGLAYRAELEWVRRVVAPVEHRAYGACRVVVVNYESVRVLLERAYGSGYDVRRLTYAPPTAFAPDPDTALPEPIGRLRDPAAPLIVSVSRHDGRKGLDVLVAALAGLRDGGVGFRACLVGTGVLHAAHRRLVAGLELDDRVALPGRVDDVMPYLRHCDVFVLPSLQEGSGSVSVLEAMQAGAAIVSSDVDGMPEDLRDARDALLVAPGDVAALQRALTRLLGDPELRARLGASAREVYERRFSPEPVARELASFYAGLGLERSS